MNDTMDPRRGSAPQGSWGVPRNVQENLAGPVPSMPRAHSVSYPPQVLSRLASISHRNLGVTVHPNNLNSEPEFCHSCSRVLPQIVPMMNGSTPFINPGPMADVNPLYTYSVNVILPSPSRRAPVPGFSFDHDTIQSIASSLEDYLRQHQQRAEPLNLPRREEVPAQDVEVQKSTAWRWEEGEYTLPRRGNRGITSSSGPSRDPSIRNLLNDPIDPAQLSSDTVDTIMNDEAEDPQTEEEPGDSTFLQEEEKSDGMNEDARSVAGGQDDIEDAIENLSQLGLDTPVPQPVAADLRPCKPGLSELWNTPKPVTAPSSGNSIWISSCFFVGLGVNSVGRYEYTQMILPRRPGERVRHVATTTCDKCGTVVMYGRYNSPEVVPEHPRVSVYILRLEAELVKPYRRGIQFIDSWPDIDLIIHNDLFQITEYYVEDHSTPHWVIQHSNSWDAIKKAIMGGMTWTQHWYPLKLREHLNCLVVYIQALRYLLMCKVLMATESIEFGGPRWEMPRPEFHRGSIAEEFRCWAGLQLVVFKSISGGYGNFLDFSPDANNGSGGFGY